MRSLLLRAIGCGALCYLGWRLFGAIGLVFTAPLWGLAFAKPLLQGLSEAKRLARHHAFRDVNGRYFAFEDSPIDILEDAQDQRWMRLSDIRRILPDLPKDVTMQSSFGDGVSPLGDDPRLRIRADVLMEYLAKSTSARAIKFRLWVARTVIFTQGKRASE